MERISPRRLRLFSSLETVKKQETLENEWGGKKKLAQGYGHQILLALSHYPELKDIKIEFVFTESEHPLSARATPATLMLPAHSRTYEISISTEISAEKEPILLRNLPFAIQVGQIAHELGHVVDYLNKSSLRVLADGLLYSLPAQKREMEQVADLEAIKHGFGQQVLRFSQYIYELRDKYVQESYYQDYHKYYMTPDEILKKMRRFRLYKDVVPDENDKG